MSSDHPVQAMPRLFSFLLLLICQYSYCQTYSSLIPDKEIVDFINADRLKNKVKGQRPIRQNFWLPHKDVFYYRDSADYSAKNNSFPGLFIFKRHTYNGRIISNNLDTVFSRADIDFFLQQIEAFTSQEDWIKPLKNSYLVNQSDMTDKTDYHKVKDGKTILIYSLPLFSVDKRKAIIIKGFYCGFLCGGSSYNLYQLNEKNEWEMIKEFKVYSE